LPATEKACATFQAGDCNHWEKDYDKIKPALMRKTRKAIVAADQNSRWIVRLFI
jgi:hypothetical protein